MTTTTRKVRVIDAAPANQVIELDVPVDATPEEIIDLSAGLGSNVLCHSCTDHYDLGDPETYSIVDAETGDEIWTRESDGDAAIRRFRTTLVDAVRKAEPQAMGLDPYSANWLMAMADFIADFEPNGDVNA